MNRAVIYRLMKAADEIISAAEQLEENNPRREKGLQLAEDIMELVNQYETEHQRVSGPVGLGSFLKAELERTNYKK